VVCHCCFPWPVSGNLRVPWNSIELQMFPP
jgi:hypothetical protein